MSALPTILACIAFLFALSVAAVVVAPLRRSGAIVYTLVFLTALVSLAAGLSFLLNSPGEIESLSFPVGLPWIGSHFRIDALSAFFISVSAFGAAAASFYAIGYGRHEREPHRILPFYPAFIGGMSLVLLADDAFTFLISWEFMSLASFALVIAHHREPENRKAAYVYILMASFGALALLFAFGLLAGPDGAYAFSSLRGQAGGAVLAITMLVLIGAGSKAGLVPLHVWLPLAHPAAPSHVSALMSGVMTKVAVYAFIRVTFDLVGVGTWWIAAPVMLIGGLAAVLGILHALMERDVKRLLAYSTIENIGVIFAMLGFSMAFHANGMKIPAALALSAALFHVVNHSLFKSLLFFGAGSILTSTGARDIERMGGLIHKAPMLAGVFLVGCVAISALPPFNGFASEWLAFQAVLQSPDIPQFGLKILAPTVGALLALAAALTAACFVRLFGVAFLGRPRSAAALAATDPDGWSLTAAGAIAVLCVMLGVLPAFVIDGINPVAVLLLGQGLTAQSGLPWLTIAPISPTQSSYNPLLLFVFMAFSGISAAVVSRAAASHAFRRSPAWSCGYETNGPTQYSAMSFSQPIRNSLGRIAFDAAEKVDMPLPGELRASSFSLRMRDLIWEILYERFAAQVRFVSDKLNRLQFLTIRRYLSLVFVTLVLLLLGLAAWS